MANLSAYNKEEVQQYLERIQFPCNVDNIKPDLETLRTIAKHHETAIPFGGLELIYYSKSLFDTKMEINHDPGSVLNKMVTNRREGYCIEHTTLITNILGRLGYKVYITYATYIDYQKRKQGVVEYNGDIHFICIATIDEQRYIVDFGAGIPGAPKVIPFDENPQEFPNLRVKELDTIQGQTYYVYEEVYKGSYFPHFIFSTIPYTIREVKRVKLYSDFETETLHENDIILYKSTKSGFVTLNNFILTVKENGKVLRNEVKTESERRQVYREVFGIGPLNGAEHLPNNMRERDPDARIKTSLGLRVAPKASDYNLPKKFVDLNNYILMRQNFKGKL